MLARTTLALVLFAGLASCSNPDDPASDPSPSREPSVATGTIDRPAVAEPTERLLDWQPTGHEAGARFLKGPEWEALVDASGSSVELTRDGDAVTVPAGPGRLISEVLMDDRWAVVVRQDSTETAPSRAVAVDLATGELRELVSPEPASGGSWAMTGGDLYYPTYGDDDGYCLATLALADGNGEDGWCAEPRTGWSGLTASPPGVALMTFDDARPVACRTVNLLDGSGLPQPLVGPTDCTAWDVAATPDGAVWSEVRRPRRQEEAQLHASAGDGYVDLGPGTTGTVLPCGDSVFFVRDPQGDADPARLMRWTPGHTLQVAYESASTGNAFLGEPTCAGDVLTLSSFGEDGDEQVWANVS